MTEFSVRLANRPGQLASLTRLLADAGVEIEALATVAADGHSHIRFVVQNSARVRRVLMAADLAFEERDILDMYLQRGSGSLAQMVEGLAHSGVNIDSMYLLHSDAEGFHLALTVDDADTAIRAIAG
ncbi:MAG: ACT domain-containing protein [Actinomycetia bacterium]|nr:ACT domain-containing protein [Actinomycetes bacterium]